MPYALEKYSGSSSRYACPKCGVRKQFSRYLDDYGIHLGTNVGRCNRESKCGYHLTPRQYFAENPQFEKHRQKIHKNSFSKIRATKAKRHDCIDPCHLVESMSKYDQNAFIHFLLKKFPLHHKQINQSIKDYLVGTTKYGRTIFWQVDQKRKIRTGKVIEYDAETGKRLKHFNPDWIHADLKRRAAINEDFVLKQCLFGEHLLSTYPHHSIAIVEAEKSAIIATICKDIFPNFLWLACGGKSNLSIERLKSLPRDRNLVLYPDADSYSKWEGIATEASRHGLVVKVSSLLEKYATDEEKRSGYDLGDYLIDLSAMGFRANRL